MKLDIQKINTVEDKEIFAIDPPSHIEDDEVLRRHPKIARILRDRYHYFEKCQDPLYPNRWILFMSMI